MKKLLILTIFFLNQKNQKGPVFKPKQFWLESTSNSSPSILKKLDTITYNQQTYPFIYYQVNQLQNLQLFSNLPQVDSSRNILDKNSCSFLVNGGFYDQNYQPLGWLVIDGQEISPEIISHLFNGFVQITKNQATITTTPIGTSKYGLQSGPLLIFKQALMPLKIKDDESRRRIIAAINTQNQLFFIAIISKDSEFNGPLLADTPQVLEKIAQKIGEQFITAINLDGGSASVFYTPKIFLKEFSPIGSFFYYHTLKI